MKRKTRIEIEALVDQIVAETLDVKKSELRADTHLRDDLAADSFDVVDVVMALEKELDIDIPDPHSSVPVVYFTELLAEALGLKEDAND